MASNQPRHFRIFLASPGDVAAERSHVMKVVDDLQYDPLLRGKVTLEIVAWEKKGAPPLEAGIPPQEAIRQGLPQPRDCDIVVVIFWSRMGTPVRVQGVDYKSGALYEYEDAIQAYWQSGLPRVLVYRRTEKVEVDLDDPHLAKKQEQRKQVVEFFEQFNDPKTNAAVGGYNSFETPEEFREQFEGHLKSVIVSLLETPVEAQFSSKDLSVLPELWQESPFPGLRAFTAKDSPIFFGRGRETDSLAKRVFEQNLVAVVGDSGSGKSSLVGAGLIPRLQSILGEGRLLEVRFTPDEQGVGNPFGALAAALRDLPNLNERHLAPKLQETPELLAHFLSQSLEYLPPESRILLFIDQFEELFTTVHAHYRKPFIDLLIRTVPHDRIHTVVTLRGDFYSQVLAYEELVELLETGTFPLSTANIGALYEMITKPAARAGLMFEDGLASRILEDTGSEPGSLALMAYTLDELYRMCADTGELTYAAYEELGAVQGAIGKRSEITYANLNAAEQNAISRVFQELVSVEADGTATRQRASVPRVAVDSATSRFIDVFTEARLLVQGRDENNLPYIEVAHEALLRNWERLSDWIEDAKDDLRLLRQVRQAAHEWEASGQQDYFLWSHERLQPVYAMQARLQIEFEPLVQAFIRPELERLLEQFKISKQYQRQQLPIIERFKEIGQSSIPVVVQLLPYATTRASKRDLHKLLVAYQDISIPILKLSLDSDNSQLQKSAIRALVDLAVPAVLPVLSDALFTEHQELLYNAIMAIGLLGDTGFSYVGSSASKRGLSRKIISTPNLVDRLTDLLEHPDEKIWVAAAVTLGRLKIKSAMPLLVKCLNSQSEDARESILDAMQSMIDKTNLWTVIDLLDDTNERVRVNAAQALNRIAAPESLPALLKALQDKNASVRFNAVQAIGKIGNEEDIIALINMIEYTRQLDNNNAKFPTYDLNSRNRIVVDIFDTVADSIIKLKGANTVAYLCDTLKSENAKVRYVAVSALAELNDSTVIPMLLTSLSDNSADVRRSAARALGKVGDSSIVPQLLQALEDKDPQLRMTAATALGQIGHTSSIAALNNCLLDVDSKVRDRVAEVLGQIKDESSVPFLIEALHATRRLPYSHGNKFSEALQEIGTSDALDAVKAWLLPSPLLPKRPEI